MIRNISESTILKSLPQAQDINIINVTGGMASKFGFTQKCIDKIKYSVLRFLRGEPVDDYEFLEKMCLLIAREKSRIIELLSDKPCIGRTREGAQKVVNELLTKMETAMDRKRGILDKGKTQEFILAEKEGILLIMPVSDGYRVQLQIGSVIEQDFVCFDYTTEIGHTGTYLSIYNQQNGDVDMGYSIVDVFS